MTKVFLLVSLFLLSTACIKTADQVQREKRFDRISDQMGDTQGLVADMVTQMKDMQSQLDKMNGRLEELEHKQAQVNPENLIKMNETLNVLKTQQETDTAQLTQIQNEIKEQRAFLEKVTNSLSSVKERAEAPVSKAEKKKSARAELEKGLKYIKDNKFDQARKELEALIDHNDLTPGDKNKVLHGLGKVEYYSGNHEKAMVYFSKIFTRFPKASLAPSSLIFIGRSLEKMGKKEEAKQAFQKVVEDYKGTKEANEARKEL
jgi:TolA-binding protein